MGECVFCDIVAKQAPASVVYEDDSTLGFMDLYPATMVMS
jgi:histidine triad (HIT) family protein